MNTAIVSALTALSLLFPAFAAAHSTISPSQSLTSKYETFTLNVPTEKDMPTTAMRLVIPKGVDRVMPIVKPGWRIQVDKDVEGNVTEIRWSGGSIPADQKDMFLLSARTPAEPMTLVWKAYQTYSDGTIVAWEQDPKTIPEGADRVEFPYSVTEVTTDTAAKPTPNTPVNISLIALALSMIALIIAFIRRSA